MSKRKMGMTMLFILVLFMGFKAIPVKAAPAWMKNAAKLNMNAYTSGEMSWTDEDDECNFYYKIYVPIKVKMKLVCKAYVGVHPFELYILDSKGYTKKTFVGSSWVYDLYDDVTCLKTKVTLNAGYYYLKLSKSSNDEDVDKSDVIEWDLSIDSSPANKPVIKKIKRLGRTKIRVYLKKYPAIDGYLVYMKQGKKGKYKLIKKTKKTNFVFKKLKRKKKYYFKVQTYIKTARGFLYSPFSKVKTFNTK